MALTDRNLTPGTRLVARYKKQEYMATVVEGEKGGLRYRLEDGREFKSPSSAGSAVMDGQACNGWRFWSLDGLPNPEAAGPKAVCVEKRKEGVRNIKKVANQKGMPEGVVRWWCDACCASFLVEGGQEPMACPTGHMAQELNPTI